MTAISAETYAAGLWRRLLKRKHGGMVVGPDEPDLDRVAEQLRIVQETLAGAPDAGIDPARAHDIPAMVELMARNLADDVRGHARSGPFVLSFMPTATGHAYCTLQDELGRALDRPLIVLHQGLLYASLRLADCIVLENLQGELERYRRDGAEAFCQAARSFRARNLEGMLREAVAGDRNSDVQVAALGGAVGARLLMFIAWHELGHVERGDLVEVALAPGERSATAREARSREAERLADEFAAGALLASSSSPAFAWSNAAPVYLFFRWLEAMERVDPGLREGSHPPPGERAEALRAFLLEHAGDGVPEHFEWIDSRIPHWSRGLRP